MELTGRTCSIEPFAVGQALVKAGFDIGPLVNVFHEELYKQLSKRGLVIAGAPGNPGGDDFTIEGQFVRIDAGNRAARYFLTFMAGAATLEVEGRLYHGEFPVMHLHARGSQSMGVLGGSSERMLKTCAAGAANQLASQVLEALSER